MRLRALLVAVLAACVLAPVALADGDPASDTLITSQVFYPYYSNTPKPAVNRLQQTVADANKRGFTIRVAVITSPYDLGSVSALWHKPQPYARFLSLELAFAYKGRLLVVNPNGFGYVDGTKPDPATLKFLQKIPIEKGTEGLLLTADRAVRALAAKSGYKLPAAAPVKNGSGSSMDTIVIAIAAAVGALIVAGVEIMRRRRRGRAVAQH